MKRLDLLIANDRGLQGVLARLREAHDEVRGYERHLRAAKRRRGALILKALHAGMTTREVAVYIPKENGEPANSATVVFLSRQALAPAPQEGPR